MHTYEIRILSQGRTKMVIEAIHLSDYAAIRAGEKYAAGQAFEVWRGMQCIYDNSNGALPAGRRRPDASFSAK